MGWSPLGSDQHTQQHQHLVFFANYWDAGLWPCCKYYTQQNGSSVNGCPCSATAEGLPKLLRLLAISLQGPGIDQLMQLLLHDSAFARAVQQQDCHGAASAAICVVKVSRNISSTSVHVGLHHFTLGG